MKIYQIFSLLEIHTQTSVIEKTVTKIINGKETVVRTVERTVDGKTETEIFEESEDSPKPTEAVTEVTEMELKPKTQAPVLPAPEEAEEVFPSEEVKPAPTLTTQEVTFTQENTSIDVITTTVTPQVSATTETQVDIIETTAIDKLPQHAPEVTKVQLRPETKDVLVPAQQTTEEVSVVPEEEVKLASDVAALEVKSVEEQMSMDVIEKTVTPQVTAVTEAKVNTTEVGQCEKLPEQAPDVTEIVLKPDTGEVETFVQQTPEELLEVLSEEAKSTTGIATQDVSSFEEHTTMEKTTRTVTLQQAPIEISKVQEEKLEETRSEVVVSEVTQVEVAVTEEKSEQTSPEDVKEMEDLVAPEFIFPLSALAVNNGEDARFM